MSRMQRKPDVPTLAPSDELDGARSTTEPAPPLSDSRAPIRPQPTRSLGMTLPLAAPPVLIRASNAPPTWREDALDTEPPRDVARPGSESGLTPHSRKRTWDSLPAISEPVKTQASLGRTLESRAAIHAGPAERDLSGVEPSPNSTLHSVTNQASEASPTRSLPGNAPVWMKRARELATSLEASISLAQSGQEPSQSVLVGVDRAYDAWVAGGFSNPDVAAVTRSVRQAYRAVMCPTSDPERLVADSAHALFKSLPPSVARWVSPTFLAQMVGELRSHASEPDAVVRGTMRVLGWDATSERSAQRLIAAAQHDSEASVEPR